jgi:hypothetical protein
MGVTYKLNSDVVDFIIAQRKSRATLSCRELSELVLAQFQVAVSKSSVHEVLKEHNIVSARGRKPKGDTFKIPAEKKAQIKAQLPPRETVITPPAPSIPELPTPLSFPSALVGNPDMALEPPVDSNGPSTEAFEGDKADKGDNISLLPDPVAAVDT